MSYARQLSVPTRCTLKQRMRGCSCAQGWYSESAGRYLPKTYHMYLSTPVIFPVHRFSAHRLAPLSVTRPFRPPSA